MFYCKPQPEAAIQLTPFAADVLQGLNAQPKKLSSKWFYDERGDTLFQAIMASPEYYLTNAEREIFRLQADKFYAATGGAAFDLVELGAGDGTKTQYLIEHFLERNADFRYLPIDISQHALDELSGLVNKRWPNLNFTGVVGDYFAALANLPESDTPRLKMLLFPGANIGNFTPAYAKQFLKRIRQNMRAGDLLVIGFDLKKDPARILAAYNDAAGQTRDFNLNLLRRINRELHADFDLSKWSHWPIYDPLAGAARSFLVSREAQVVTIKALERSFHFSAAEAIDMEISQKYSLTEIEALATDTGFTVSQHLTDKASDFVDSIWRV